MPSVSRRITFGRVVAPRLNLPVDDAAISAGVPEARACIAEIAQLLDGNTWLAGGTFSLADLLLAPHLSMFAMAPEGKDILAKHPALTAWLARMEARPSMQATTFEKMLALLPPAA
jgi:glutathione S-transferase